MRKIFVVDDEYFFRQVIYRLEIKWRRKKKNLEGIRVYTHASVRKTYISVSVLSPKTITYVTAKLKYEFFTFYLPFTKWRKFMVAFVGVLVCGGVEWSDSV